jgi:phasin
LGPDEWLQQQETRVMVEATANPKAKVKPTPEAFDAPKFETPKFEMPKMDMPAAFREFAEKGAAQAKETYERMKAAAEETTAVLEDTYTTTAKGVTAYNLRLIEIARENSNAAFDFAGQFIAAKSLAEAVELSSAHARKQFETLSAQSKDLAALAQKVATDSVEPIKNGVNQAFSKVA